MQIMNRNDKNRKYTPLNINNVFKGKAVEPQNKPSYKVGGMQNIGKVSSMRRVPPPKWVPSLKAETGVSDARQIINQPGSGWVNSVSTQDNCDSSITRSQGLTSKLNVDKNWNSKTSTNKPFFLIGQEFPSLPSDSGHEPYQESNVSKDNTKTKESESLKSKIDDLRHRDTNISVSTLNRIDALSISKSSKGDIAATGWAAEDEEPNFDEKIIFSDEDSSNEMQNWHSDNDDQCKSERLDNNRESVDILPIISDVWHDQNQAILYQQFQQMPMSVNVPGQYMGNPQFQQNLINRNPPGTIASLGDDQTAFMSSVAEQRNARNMEYFIAIERARQKKFGNQSGRGSCGLIEDQNQILEQSMIRSRHTSITSDTTESMNASIEMGPPGGPPLMHHMHKPHLQPQISPMMIPHNMTVIPPSIPAQSMIRFTQHQYMVPHQAVPIDPLDPKLMEKFFEFLKTQAEQSPDSTGAGAPINSEIIDPVPQPMVLETDTKSLTQEPQVQSEPDKTQHHSAVIGPPVALGLDKEQGPVSDKTLSSGTQVVKDTTNEPVGDRDTHRKSKPNYLGDMDKYEQPKKSAKNKSYKEYRPNKNSYKTEYGVSVNLDRDYYQHGDNDDTAYEDYNTYKQHYSRDYKSSRSYTDNQAYNYYSSSDQQYANGGSGNRDAFSNDYQYKSNSLKTKSSKSKDLKGTGGSSNPLADHYGSQDRDSHSYSGSKKYHQSSSSAPTDSQDCWSHDAEYAQDKSKMKDGKKNSKSSSGQLKPSSTSYQSQKKYTDSRSSYKDKSGDMGPQQEYSMGFAVNPKDSRKNIYSNSYNRRNYYSDYHGYYNYQSTSNGGAGATDYDDNYSHYHHQHHHQDNYYSSQDYYHYDRHAGHSGAAGSKRSYKNNASSDQQWRPSKEEKSNTDSGSRNNPDSTGQSKYASRNTRKSDKRQFSTSKDCPNDNDQEEWETASEGGSVRSGSVARDLHKAVHNRQSSSTTDKSLVPGIGTDTRKVTTNKSSSSYSCNGGNNTFHDNNGNQDGSSGASGSAGGTRFFSTNRSNVSQTSRSVDSSQTKSADKTPNNDNRNSDSLSKNCSNNNNSSKESTKFNGTDCKPAESTGNNSNTANSEKFNDLLDNEDMLYDNGEYQFQEVLSKATKKSRKLEELKRQKEESRLEQKRLEAQKYKSKVENNRIKKPLNRREPLPRSTGGGGNSKCEATSIHKYENKTASITRDKESATGNTFKKWENNKVAMQIGSWDNSLADEISSEKKAPPKPIGTPAASTGPWNKKAKGSFDTTNTVNICQHSLSNDSIKLSADIEAISQPFIVSSESPEVNFSTTMSYATYNGSIYNPSARTSEENKIETSIETQTSDIAIHDTISFEYDVKNMNCDKNHRNSLSSDRNVQSNDQKLLNDKISSVKTIWDNQPASGITTESKVASSPSINQELDIHPVTVSISQDVSNQRNIDNNLASPSVPIPNVCKVKPQLQHDFKKDHNEIIISSQPIQFRNSPGAFISQNQGSFVPYPRFADFMSDSLHSDAFASIYSNNQSGVHYNYNLPNPHLIDSAMLRTNTQEQLLTNKMSFINQSQSSFYPQQATTPKLMSNTPAQLPINMDAATHPHHMQQLLLTRQNSLTSMMQQNPMPIPFIQSGQQPIQAQTPLFPNPPLIGATNFPSQLNPFSQTHLPPPYAHGNFTSLHPHHPHHPSQFQSNQQMLLNQHSQQAQATGHPHSVPHQHHHHLQQQQSQQHPTHHAHPSHHPTHSHPPTHHQLIQAPSLSHDRVINSGPGQSGVFNSVIGPSDISTNTGGVPDFNGQPKPITHNNIVHGMNGSAFMLPPNLNILMKPPLFATNSQYNNFTAPIQSNLLSLKSGYDYNTSLKAVDVDHYKHSEQALSDRNVYCNDPGAMQKPNDDYYPDVPEYENCDINYENWMPNLRYSKVDIFAANNLMSTTFDFRSQKSPMQFSPMEPGGDGTYRNYITPYRDNHSSLPAALQTNTANLQYIISPRIKQQFSQDQSTLVTRQQHPQNKSFDNQSFITAGSYSANSKNTNSNGNGNNSNNNGNTESSDSNKMSMKSVGSCGVGGGLNSSISETTKDGHKEISNVEKSLSDNKKSLKQRTSYSDNFDEKNQTWSLMETDKSVTADDNGRSSLKNSCNAEQNSHSPNKHFGNLRSGNAFDMQCQYGYDETQLSSQTAESLGKYDHDQLKKVIMKLREGPVMTGSNCTEFDFSFKGNTPIPRLMPVQSSRNKSVSNKPFSSSSSSGGGNSNFSAFPSDSNNTTTSSSSGNFAIDTSVGSVGHGFYSRNRALTPPVSQFRSTYRSKTNRNQNIIVPINGSGNANSKTVATVATAIITNSTSNSADNGSNNSNGNGDAIAVAVTRSSSQCTSGRVSRQKCDSGVVDLESLDDSSAMLMCVGSTSPECDIITSSTATAANCGTSVLEAVSSISSSNSTTSVAIANSTITTTSVPTDDGPLTENTDIGAGDSIL